MGIAVPIEESGRQHHQKPTMEAFVASSVMALAATTGASPAADPALIYSGLGGVVAPVIGTVDTGLKFHPESGAVTLDFTEAQKEAAPELAANQKDIKHLAYTGHVVQPVVPSVVHTGYHLYGKREAEAEADPALVYTTGHTVVPHVVAPAVYTHGGLVAHPNGAVTPDYTPAQKVAAATHLAAKVHTPVYSGIYSPYIRYGKREAEPEAQPEAKSDAWGYGLGSVYGYPHVYGGVYGGYPYHYGKRDAEAKSDSWGYGLGGVYGYPHVYGGVYGGYPYHHGKRNADADAYKLFRGFMPNYGGYNRHIAHPYGHFLSVY